MKYHYLLCQLLCRAYFTDFDVHRNRINNYFLLYFIFYFIMIGPVITIERYYIPRFGVSGNPGHPYMIIQVLHCTNLKVLFIRGQLTVCTNLSGIFEYTMKLLKPKKIGGKKVSFLLVQQQVCITQNIIINIPKQQNFLY